MMKRECRGSRVEWNNCIDQRAKGSSGQVGKKRSKTLSSALDPRPSTLGHFWSAGRVSLLAVCIAAALLFSSSVARADSLDMLKKTYAGIQTVEARFNQRISIATLKRERESKGEFYYKRGKGFLWKYSAPVPKVFLYDGRAIWQADEEKPFVTKDRVDKAKMQGSFLDLVDDVSKLDELFTIQETGQNKEGTMLLLMPRKEGMLQSARLWVDTNYLIKKIEITEVTGNINTLSFSSTRINKPLDDTLFVFNPGKKEIVER
jgi:chaperone LolA